MPLFYALMHGDLATAFSFILGIALAITVHEFAHAKIADWAGDPTPRKAGRVTLNPLAHYDPIGTTLILLFGMGWGKPVPVNPFNFRRPREDEVLVSAGGAAANLVLAVIFGMLLRFSLVPEVYRHLAFFIVELNVMLAVFNLIPLWPLDGSHVLVGLLQREPARKVALFYQTHGITPLIVFLLAMNILRVPILMYPIDLLVRLIAGPAAGF